MCPDDPQYWPQREPEAPQPPKPESTFVRNFKRFAGPVGVALFAAWKYIGIAAKAIVPAFQVLKFGKVLTTMGSMVLSVWFYQLAFGWRFSVGFVLLIFIHEMGHVFVAWRQGLPISAPVFIPGMGAVIFNKRESKTAWEAALMGIGGPIGGAIGAVVCHLIYAATGDPLFLGLAYSGYFLNLFNLAPMFPLDGGWIVGSISPYLWLIGLVVIVGGFFTGVIRNPIILLLLIVSIPQLWMGIRHGKPMGSRTMAPSTPQQKWAMGLMYIALIGILAFAMGATHIDEPHRKFESKPPAQSAQVNRLAANS